ncbi:Murein L,D-transpeptidase YcbB/YkuD [Daejeonella rubra]|uniref:Murein L,D-transpeptidase YcbB/YkuD n=2 Tax=Daejeonella rubra TaxID=990371 RepID=A0A1G9S900_9SPHI|nr:Murein L,D-transpeptidase YcbB/YkuD [Daejeonella rubra]
MQFLKMNRSTNTLAVNNQRTAFFGIKNKVKRIIFFLSAGSLFLFASSCKNSNSRFADNPQQLLDSTYYIEYVKSDPKLNDQIDLVKTFYRDRKFELAWYKNNEMVPQAEKMLDVIRKASDEGLNPADYLIIDFEKLYAELKASKKDFERFSIVQKEIDVALTATYFIWASDYYRGVVVPNENKEIEWDVKRNRIKLDLALLNVLGEKESQYPYANFSPLHPEYTRLKTALAAYRKIETAGSWPIVQAAPKLKKGMQSPVIPALAKRMGVNIDSSTVYSEELFNAVRQFQTDQGLKPDGALGAETIRIMNVPIKDRIKQIILNMERWRWLPRSFESNYLLVNIPEFKVYVFEEGKSKISMNVIVGKALNSTPVFSDKMEYVVLSPYWNVPFSIIKEDLAPKLASNPSYLDRLDMEIITSKGENVSPSSIDWNTISEDNWNYTLRRRPGPKNDLGDVKFIFPNSNDIYLHDTPHDELFSQAKRGFSHGCVRVEKPIDLAVYLLRDQENWDREKILSAISERKEKQIKLKVTLPVYLVYFTAFTDESGKVHFRDDIYGHDKTLAEHYFN